MNIERELVVRFYEQVWNQQDKSVIAEIIDRDIRFHGSLGMTAHGHSGFVEYLDSVHTALDDYECIIEDLVVEPLKAFARMQFRGVHKGQLLGYPPTGKSVAWSGAALFTFQNNKIIDLWVLGDIRGLERQLAG